MGYAQKPKVAILNTAHPLAKGLLNIVPITHGTNYVQFIEGPSSVAPGNYHNTFNFSPPLWGSPGPFGEVTQVITSTNVWSVLYEATYPPTPNLLIGSIGIWFKTTNAGSGFRALLEKQFAWGLFLIDNILSTYDWSVGAQRSTGINCADGAWHSAVMTFQSGVTNGTNIYLDGKLVLNLTYTSQSSDGNLGYGCNSAGSGSSITQDMTGYFDLPAIWNRVISPREVSYYNENPCLLFYQRANSTSYLYGLSRNNSVPIDASSWMTSSESFINSSYMIVG